MDRMDINTIDKKWIAQERLNQWREEYRKLDCIIENEADRDDGVTGYLFNPDLYRESFREGLEKFRKHLFKEPIFQ